MRETYQNVRDRKEEDDIVVVFFCSAQLYFVKSKVLNYLISCFLKEINDNTEEQI